MEKIQRAIARAGQWVGGGAQPTRPGGSARDVRVAPQGRAAAIVPPSAKSATAAAGGATGIVSTPLTGRDARASARSASVPASDGESTLGQARHATDQVLAEAALPQQTRLNRIDAALEESRQLMDRTFAQHPPVPGLGKGLGSIATKWVGSGGDLEADLASWARPVLSDARFQNAEGAVRIPHAVKALVQAISLALAANDPTKPASQVREEALSLVSRALPQEVPERTLDRLTGERAVAAISHNSTCAVFARALGDVRQSS